MEEYGPASINSPDLKGTELMEKVIGTAAPVYEDTFDDYDIEDSAEKGETLESRDGTKQYSMNNDSFVVKEDVKGNRYLQAVAVTNGPKLGQADISAEAVSDLKDALIMMDVMIPGPEENTARSYGQIGVQGDRSYVKFDLKESGVNIRENYKDDKAAYPFEAGKTYNVAVLYQNGTASVYVNGKLIHKKESSAYGNAVKMGTIAVATGGKIDDVRIYDASADRTEYEEILEIMKNVDQEEYAEEGWEEFQVALRKAEALMKS